jgi:hypothetical protein
MLQRLRIGERQQGKVILGHPLSLPRRRRVDGARLQEVAAKGGK